LLLTDGTQVPPVLEELRRSWGRRGRFVEVTKKLPILFALSQEVKHLILSEFGLHLPRTLGKNGHTDSLATVPLDDELYLGA
jgi:hypothetical protein